MPQGPRPAYDLAPGRYPEGVFLSITPGTAQPALRTLDIEEAALLRVRDAWDYSPRSLGELVAIDAGGFSATLASWLNVPISPEQFKQMIQAGEVSREVIENLIALEPGDDPFSEFVAADLANDLVRGRRVQEQLRAGTYWPPAIGWVRDPFEPRAELVHLDGSHRIAAMASLMPPTAQIWTWTRVIV